MDHYFLVVVLSNLVVGRLSLEEGLSCLVVGLNLEVFDLVVVLNLVVLNLEVDLFNLEVALFLLLLVVHRVLMPYFHSFFAKHQLSKLLPAPRHQLLQLKYLDLFEALSRNSS